MHVRSTLMCLYSLAKINKRTYSSKQIKNVAFLGLGNMGKYMSANLVKKGFKVQGFDISKVAQHASSKEGVVSTGCIAEAVDGVDAVVTMLPVNEDVLEAYLAKDGVIANAPKGCFLMDSSTVDPEVPKRIQKQALKKGMAFIDAPVTGGQMGAKKGELVFMVGGRKEDYERSLPLLKAMGTKPFHCGDIGSGEIVKLTNNMIMAITAMGTAECMNMGIKMGLDPKILREVLDVSSARSWSTGVYCPIPGLVSTSPSSNNYDTGFRNDLLVKDLTLASTLAMRSRSPIPLGATASQLYRIVQLIGYGHKDFSFLYQLLSREVKKKCK